MSKEFTIKHFSYRLSKDASYYYINLIFEPLADYLKTWSELESTDYVKSSVIVDLEGYKEASITSPEILEDMEVFNKHLQEVISKYFTEGYMIQNNILQQLDPPFATTFRFSEYFTKNRIVDACIETLNDLQLKEDSLGSGQDLIDCLSSLKYHWE